MPSQVVVEPGQIVFELLPLGLNGLIGYGLPHFTEDVESQFVVGVLYGPKPNRLTYLHLNRMIGVPVGRLLRFPFEVGHPCGFEFRTIGVESLWRHVFFSIQSSGCHLSQQG